MRGTLSNSWYDNMKIENLTIVGVIITYAL